MTFPQFIEAVDKLVLQWPAGDAFDPRGIPRQQLQAIYDDVREQGVHDIAELQRQRDEAMRKLHKRYLTGDT